MGGIFKNKFFIILLIITCLLTIMAIVLNMMGKGNIIADVANTAVYPFEKFADIVKESAGGFVAYFTKFNELKQENKELKARIFELENEIDDAQNIIEENKMLNSFYELKKDHWDFVMQNASVIARSAGNYIPVLTISLGSFHGVELKMPVIAEGGTVVGYISEVDEFTSKVTPFVKAANSVGAYIKRSRDEGIAEGVFELERSGLCKLSHLSKEADVKKGDKIYSSGLGGVYPLGLYIGEVSDVYIDKLTQTPAAYINPAVNFNKIKDVMIIYSWIREFY